MQAFIQFEPHDLQILSHTLALFARPDVPRISAMTPLPWWHKHQNNLRDLLGGKTHARSSIATAQASAMAMEVIAKRMPASHFTNRVNRDTFVTSLTASRQLLQKALAAADAANTVLTTNASR